MNNNEKTITNIANTIINNAHKNNKLSHCYIFSAEKNYIPSKEINFCIKKILNKNDAYDINKYSDLYVIDGSSKQIKKENFITILSKMSETALDKVGKKILLIKNLENTNVQTMNSLLKFIEEPTKDTYIIITTNFINKILNTIKSRSQIIKIPPQSLDEKTNELKDKISNKKILNLLSKIYTGENFSNRFIEEFEYHYETIINLLEMSLHKPENIYIGLLNLITRKNYKDILEILSSFFLDVAKGKDNKIQFFSAENSLIKKYRNKNFNLYNIHKEINKFIYEIQKNVNFELAKITLLIKIKEIYLEENNG